VSCSSTSSPGRRTTASSSGRHVGRSAVRLERLPTLPKETLVDEFDRIVTDPRLRLVELEEHMHGPDAGDLFLDRVVPDQGAPTHLRSRF
jgi:hypothetical protein